MNRWLIAVGVGLCLAPALAGQSPSPVTELGIKYVRDSAEYAALTRQTYRLAGDAVQRAAQQDRRSPWAVVLDLDETVLDNSTYQLERVAYSLPFDSSSWNAWTMRRAAGAVPGVVEFIGLVRRSSGHVAWISNRDTLVADATRLNLQTLGLWNDDDRLCLQSPDRPKRIRRAEVLKGAGDCAWPGTQMAVVTFVGDQMGDFPAPDEDIPETGDEGAFGRTCFLLPNPMYGDWTARVTRWPLP
jgi:5'-nucleotidase (lipoprotein e(P4) family)